MSAADPRPTQALARCVCRHAVNTHQLNSKRMRTSCGSPRWHCRVFVSAKVAGR